MLESNRVKSSHIYLLSFIQPTIVFTTMFVGGWTTCLGIIIPLVIYPLLDVFFSVEKENFPASKNLNIKDQHIINGVKKAYNSARLEEIKSGKLKNLVKDNTLIIDSSHNPGGSKSLNDYLQTLNCNKHVIIGMMENKDHKKYISYFKDISSMTVIDIPGNSNAIKGKDLERKFKDIFNVSYKENIEIAIKSLPIKKNDIVVITGSLYLASEMLKLN